MLKRSVLALVLALGMTQVHADESAIKKVLTTRFPGVEVSSITKTPYSGLYEVVIDGQVSYVDDNANYLFLGSVVDLKTRRNLTQERTEKLNTVNLSSLPLEHAMKFVKGDGSRKLIVFSDPECPYCKRLEQELIKVNNLTLYVFPFPLDSLHPGTTAVSKSIWCARDKNLAWQDALLKNKLPKNDGTCDNPIAADIALGNSLHITGTPTLIFANGQRIAGAMPAEKIEQLLNAIK
ncbi:MAG: DsbC family protein [Betaproteobacteria bacterium]|nr:DsbC family protein [Betaproteobacteria bacterium]